uniref:ARAD1B11374p n=1 Tax=Blastobotrys adeninivorans TaxID=409370 RepID=A0A060T5Y0_BLAAD
MDLISWLNQNGARISPKVCVKDIPGAGKGVVCVNRIERGEVIAYISRGQLLNDETIRKEGRLPPQDEQNMLSGTLLLSWYVYKYHDSEKWKCFFETLPTLEELEGVPLAWSQDRRQELPASLQKVVQDQEAKFLEQESTVRRLEAKEDPSAEFDGDRFKWAWLCVNTRCIYMNVRGNATLVPFVDFLNHSPDTSVKVKIDYRGLTLTSTVSYDEGEEVYLCYGPHDNSTLLTEYGFTLTGNIWDTVDISRHIDLSPRQREWLDELGYGGDNFTVNLQGPSFRTVMALAATLESSNGIQIPRTLQTLSMEGEESLYPGLSWKLKEVLERALDELDYESNEQSANELIQGWRYILTQAIKREDENNSI